jgi:serine/threonine-protein kinase
VSQTKGEPLSASERAWAERAIRRGLLTPAHLKQAVAARAAAEPDAPIEVVLVSLGFLAEDDLEGLGRTTRRIPILAAPGGGDQFVQLYGACTVLEPLGRGPCGPVYRAIHGESGRTVALKVIPDNALNRPFAKRFSTSVALALGVSHPRVAEVLDGGVQEGAVFAATEFLEGATLLEAVHSEGPMKVDRAADLLAQVAGGLRAAHAAGLLHGNLKPENVFFTADGGVKVTDFGLGRGDPEYLQEHADQAGSLVFSLAPEQWSRGTTAASDFYALGILWQFMLTGRFPFQHRWTREIRKMHEQAEPPPLPGAAGGISRKLLEKNPARRLASADRLIEALASLHAGRAAPRLRLRRR